MLADGFLSNLFFEGSAVTYEYLPFTFAANIGMKVFSLASDANSKLFITFAPRFCISLDFTRRNINNKTHSYL